MLVTSTNFPFCFRAYYHQTYRHRQNKYSMYFLIYSTKAPHAYPSNKNSSGIQIGLFWKSSDLIETTSTLIIPKKNCTVRLTSDLRYSNMCMEHKQYPIHKMAEVLRKLKGICYAISLDLNVD